MSLFGKALRSIAGTGKILSELAMQERGSLPADLEKLERIEPGFAHKVVNYIEGTGDARVLSTLTQRGGGWLSAARFVHRSDSPGVDERRKLFIDPATDTDLVVRYVKVLAATLKGDRSKLQCLPATDSTAFDVQVFLIELNHGYQFGRPAKDQPPLPRQPRARLMEIIGKLGGAAEDLFDVVFYHDTGYYSGRGRGFAHSALDLPDLVRAHPQAFVAQDKRLPLHGRQRLFDFIEKQRLAAEPPFSELVLKALGDGSKTIREAAVRAFEATDSTYRETLATDLLASGKSSMRSSMAEVLIGVDSATAREALRAHLEREKTVSIRALIEGYLGAANAEPAANLGATSGSAGEDTASQSGYQALDGSFVAIPPLRVPEDGPLPPVSPEIRARLLELGEKLESGYQQDLKKENPPHYLKYAAPLAPKDFAAAAEKLVQGDWNILKDKTQSQDTQRRLCLPETQVLVAEFRETYPLKPVLQQDFERFGNRMHRIGMYDFNRKVVERSLGFLERDGTADFRFLENVLTNKFHNKTSARDTHPYRCDLLRALFEQRSHYDRDPLEELSDNQLENLRPAVWPLIAENLWLADCWLGLKVEDGLNENTLTALSMLAFLPALPARYGAILLNIAMIGKKEERKKARAVLDRSSGYENQLTMLLEDSRQDVRAAAAKWLGEIGWQDAVKPLGQRLKKEKSAIVQAALLAALKAFGQDISAHVGPAALLKDAERRLKSASFKEVDWLDLATLPQVRYMNGQPVPSEVLRWWIALSVKLKAPGETGLFDLYLEQLQPEDACRLSTWLFDAWIDHDTAPPERADAEAKARQCFNSIGSYWKAYFPERADWTKEQQLVHWFRQAMAETPNSGAKSKGLLALTVKVTPAHAVAKVRTYLRKHGGRTSQSTALLELMAAKGDAMSLQVVIASATRLRQKGVQAKAKEMVQAVADRKDWTMDQLADRTVPTGGLEDDGTLELPCSGGDKVYLARLDEKLGLSLFNPDGKAVKTLPASGDEETKAAKKALSSAKKEIKQAVGFQTNRLFEAMCCGRSWQLEDWQRDFYHHPLMRKLVERLIWQCTDSEGTALATFRPTAEGEFIDAADADVALSRFTVLRLAHASTMTGEEAAAWRGHMKDYEIVPLFDQVRQDLPVLQEEMKAVTAIDDRLGWVYDAFTLRSAAARAGYERGDALDGGGFDCYTKHFSSIGIVAVVQFTGNHVAQENIQVALKTLFFERLPAGQSRGYGSNKKLQLDKPPPVLVTECWADLHKIAEKAAFDPDWEKVAPW